MVSSAETAAAVLPGDAGAPEVVLRGTTVRKSYGATQALTAASLDVRRGEVHAVLGENGSGKSTLVKVLAGVQSPDAGTVEVGGTGVALRDPRAAARHGIAAVFQEVLVVGNQSIVDSVWLGLDGVFRKAIDPGRRLSQAAAVLRALLGRDIDLGAPVESLPLSEQQACCIARALVREPAVLILDEATSALDVATRDRLLAILRQRAEHGGSTIFISHRMDEVTEIADRMTVMRAGRTIATVTRGEADADELVRLMAGEDRPAAPPPAPTAGHGPVVLKTAGLRLRPDAAPIDLEVRGGELIGLAGLDGHGQERFLQVLWGERAAGGSVRVARETGEVTLRSRRHAAAHGVAYVPRDRRAGSVFAPLSIQENFGIATLAADRRKGLLSRRALSARFQSYVDKLGIKLADGGAEITTLSGGNQQKVVLARWLATGPRVLLLNDPTRGIDPGAKQDVYALLRRITAEGVAVVMLSTEVDEHVALMDRVLVFREHGVFRELPRAELNRAALVASFFGREEHSHG